MAAAARLLRKKKKKTEEACESIEGTRSEETVQAVGGFGFYWHTARDTLIIKLCLFLRMAAHIAHSSFADTLCWMRLTARILVKIHCYPGHGISTLSSERLLQLSLSDENKFK